jgi:hypothetical protein
MSLATGAMAQPGATQLPTGRSPGDAAPSEANPPSNDAAILRGEAAKEIAEGKHALYSSAARAVDAVTAGAVNEYAYRTMQRYNADREKRLGRRLKRRIDLFDARQQNLHDNPDYADLMNGDTLNLLLQDLWNPAITPSSLRSAMVPLSVSNVHALSFQIARLGGTISRRILTADNGKGWPIALNSPSLESAKKAYLDAVYNVLELICQQQLSPEAIRAVDHALDGLKAAVDRTIPQTDRFYVQAQLFLKDLTDQARLIGDSSVRNLLADLDGYPGTTAVELVEFMRWYNLRFGPAKPGTPERELYPKIYEALLAVRQRLPEELRNVSEDRKAAAKEEAMRRGGVFDPSVLSLPPELRNDPAARKAAAKKEAMRKRGMLAPSQFPK